MFDIGWTELLLIGIVALIVIGPKDLPAMFHTLGRFVARAKGMAREFQNAMNEAAREAGVEDIAKDLKKATSPRALGLDKLQEAATKFENWDPTIPSPDKASKNKPTPEQDAVGEKILKASAKAAGVSSDDAPVKGAAKGAAKKAAPKKTAAKKTSVKKPATTKPKAIKPKATKLVTKKPVAKKPGVKTASVKKPGIKTATPKKPVSVKPRAKKTTTKSSGAKTKP